MNGVVGSQQAGLGCGRALRSLEDRLSGTQEAGGSNPSVHHCYNLIYPHLSAADIMNGGHRRGP